MNERGVTHERRVRGNGEISPEELQRDIDRTRAELNDTLNAISQRLSPGQLVDQALDYFQTGPKEYAMNLGAQLRDNPLPATLAAIGIGWLMYSIRNPQPYRYVDYGTEEYTSEGISESTGTMKQSMAEKGRAVYGSAAESVQDVREKLSGKSAEVKARVGRRMDETRESMKRGARSMASGIRRSSDATRDTFSYMLREQPLVLGLMGIAIGAAMGAGLPTTRRERETLGPTRDELVRRARETGREQMEKTREELRKAVSEESAPASSSPSTSYDVPRPPSTH